MASHSALPYQTPYFSLLTSAYVTFLLTNTLVLLAAIFPSQTVFLHRALHKTVPCLSSLMSHNCVNSHSFILKCYVIYATVLPLIGANMALWLLSNLASITQTHYSMALHPIISINRSVFWIPFPASSSTNLVSHMLNSFITTNGCLSTNASTSNSLFQLTKLLLFTSLLTRLVFHLLTTLVDYCTPLSKTCSINPESAQSPAHILSAHMRLKYGIIHFHLYTPCRTFTFSSINLKHTFSHLFQCKRLSF
jgi:hypothetical protein